MAKIKQNHPIILASTSKARESILRDLGLDFTIIAPDFDEEEQKSHILHLSIEKRALFLAQGKALSVSLQYKDSLVIGSDQICQLGDDVISKPKNRDEAINQLKRMRGKTHYQNNGVALFLNGQDIYSYTQIAKMEMRDLTDLEIESYVDLDNPIGCAGSYKIESLGRHLFSNIEGDISCISGIAVQPLLRFLYKVRFLTLI